MHPTHLFEDLFVLEIANNHLGSLERGKRIITQFAEIVHSHNIKAAIKLQFRNVDTFVHKNFIHRQDLRYIKKTVDTKMTQHEYAELVNTIKKHMCFTMSTPFDEDSVKTCSTLNVDIIKIASSDIKDKNLIKKIIATKKPVIISTGGSSLEDIDYLVESFAKNAIPLAINHCVSLYPCEKHDLDLNQIDFLKKRYPNNIIGFSTHEHNDDIESPMLIAYAKGARTFERHVDIDDDEITLSAYNSTPSDLNRWITAFKKAQRICGNSSSQKRVPPKEETEYLEALVRGVYAKKDLAIGDTLSEDTVYLAVPLQKGQLSCRELLHNEILHKAVKKDDLIHLDAIHSSYSDDKILQNTIYQRGL